jgi:hypothetical protein
MDNIDNNNNNEEEEEEERSWKMKPDLVVYYNNDAIMIHLI